MNPIIITDNSHLSKEKSNFNLFSSISSTKNSINDNSDLGYNISAAPSLIIENEIKNNEEKDEKNNEVIILNDKNNKNYNNKININKDDLKFNINNNENNISLLNDKNLLKQSIQDGFIPFFIKIGKDKPLYFIVKKETIFNKIIKTFITDTGNSNINSYTFFNNGKKIDKNISIENLKIKPLSIIIGIKDNI